MIGTKVKIARSLNENDGANYVGRVENIYPYLNRSGTVVFTNKDDSVLTVKLDDDNSEIVVHQWETDKL